jgi:hypothetical protein
MVGTGIDNVISLVGISLSNLHLDLKSKLFNQWICGGLATLPEVGIPSHHL